MNSKLIDIICPVYNQEKNIKNFLLPFLHMDLNNVNIILIDDGSTDNTPSIIDEIISVNKGVPFHYFKKNNGGAASARNYGLKIACSEYIWFCDPDDEVVVDMKYIYMILQRSHSDIYFFNYIHYFEGKNVSISKKSLVKGCFHINDIRGTLVNHRLNIGGDLNSFLIYPWDKIIKRSVITCHFNEKLSVYEDQLFNFQLFFSSNVNIVEFIDCEIYKYKTYKGGNSLSSTWSKTKTSDFYFFINQLRDKFHLDPRNLFKREVFYIIGKGERAEAFKTYINMHKDLGYKIQPLSSKRELFKLFLMSINVYYYAINLMSLVKSKVKHG